MSRLNEYRELDLADKFINEIWMTLWMKASEILGPDPDPDPIILYRWITLCYKTDNYKKHYVEFLTMFYNYGSKCPETDFADIPGEIIHQLMVPAEKAYLEALAQWRLRKTEMAKLYERVMNNKTDNVQKQYDEFLKIISDNRSDNFKDIWEKLMIPANNIHNEAIALDNNKTHNSKV